ncbi:MAG: hypothetical protein QXU18_05720 [Thermoplasmatales archaeon]
MLISIRVNPSVRRYVKYKSDDLRNKAVSARLKSSIRKTANIRIIFPGVSVSHEKVMNSVPETPKERGGMESSGYFS